MENKILLAARIVEYGGIVAFPTETVYGLGCDAENPKAVRKLYAMKGRPLNRPLSVHIVPEADMGFWTRDLPMEAYKAMTALWPGPVTLILKKGPHVIDEVCAGGDTVALRCPNHPVCLPFLREFKRSRGGIAAPSANLSGGVSPVTAAHVESEFAGDERLGMVLDGGMATFGIESTILDLSDDAAGPVILRTGVMSPEAIMKKAGFDVKLAPSAVGVSGDAHYRTDTKAVAAKADNIPALAKKAAEDGLKVGAVLLTAQPEEKYLSAVRRLGDTPVEAASGFYAAVRELDAAGCDILLIENVSGYGDWLALSERIRLMTEPR